MKNNISIIFIFILIGVIGCGDAAEVPVYVTINEPEIVSRSDEGTDFHDISEYFMFHRTALLGGFSYGNEIPVLAEGEEDLLIFAGIRQNTLIEQPARFEMMAPDTFRKDFIPGELANFTPTFRYYDNVKFRFIDDFEMGTTFSVEADTDSETKLVATQGVGFNNSSGGVMRVSEDHPLLIVASEELLSNFPLSGQAILELTFKTEVDLFVGVIAYYNFGSSDLIDKVILSPTTEWTKVYIDLLEEIAFAQADSYRVYIGTNHAFANTTADVEAIIDDVKFVHR